MILGALNDYYRRVAGTGEDAPPPYGFAVQKVSGAVQLDRQGRFLGLLDLRQPDKKGRRRPRLMAVPQPPGRTVAVAAAFLCDNGGYLLGHDLKGKPERAAQQFAAAADLHRAVLAGVDDPVAAAVLGHFSGWGPSAAAIDPELSAGWLVFLVDGHYAHEAPALQAAWLRRFGAAEAEAIGQCLVTGEADAPIARLHPAIKGVAGAQSSGAPLVSFNFAAAESYGKSQSFNAPVGVAAAFGYGAALNHLLRPETGRRRIIGDLTAVVWAERECPAENMLLDLADPSGLDPDDDAAPEDKARAAAIREALDRMAQGQPPAGFDADSQVRFFVLGLSPNAARLSVRLWLVDTLEALLRRIGEHQRDLALVTDFARRPPPPPLWLLVQELRPKDDEGKVRGRGDDGLAKLRGDLLRAVLTGGLYPAALLPLLLARFRADGHLTHPRVALLKALISRRRRIEKSERGELPMGLDETRTEIGYLLGRLFAALELMQRAANPGRKVNAGVADKFVGAASATPQAVFPALLRDYEAHKKKAGRDSPGLMVTADRIAAAALNALEAFPAALGPEDQGLFFLGLYQQRQAFFAGKPAQPETADQGA